MEIKNLQQVFNTFEKIGEYVQIIDLDTYEVVHQNPKLQNLLHHPTDESTGWMKEIFGEKEIHAFIDTERLLDEKSIEREIVLDAPHKSFRIIEILMEENNKKYDVQIVIPEVNREAAENDIELIHYYEKISNECIRQGVGQPEPKQGIQKMLAYLGEVLQGERVYIFEVNENGFYNNTFEWCAEGVETQIDFLQNLPPETGEQWFESFREKGLVAVDDLEKVKIEDPKVYKILKPQNIRTLVAVPLYHGDDIIGFYGIDNSSLNNIQMIRELLGMLATFTVALLRKRDLVERIRMQGMIDSMTQVGNRHALYAYMEGLMGQENLGIVYCDVTRLKHVNDTIGHRAGDEMICAVAKSLRDGFPSGDVFRAGGDEFIVFCPNVTNENMLADLSKVQDGWAKDNIVVATGTNWTSQLNETPELFADVAERQMYEEKAKWYETSGNDRRRI